MKNKIKVLTIGALALFSIGTFSMKAQASSKIEDPIQLEKTKNEGWNVPNITLGNGLTESQRQETLEILGLYEKNSKGDIIYPFYNEPIIVNGDDLVKYVTDLPQGTFNSNSKAYSSGLITRKTEGTGVTVQKMPDKKGKITITRPESVFRNAAITSGIYDADIRIGSVMPIDGSGALAGIYKIYDEIEEPTAEEAKELEQKREVAQEEMAVTSDIVDQNKGKENFDIDSLGVALADIKIELQKINSKLDKMSEEQKQSKVNEVVNKNLEKQGLSESITPQQVDSITQNMVNFSNSPAIKDKEISNQLNILKNDLSGSINKGIEKSSGFFKNVWNSIKEFFNNLFSMFNDNKNDKNTVDTQDRSSEQIIEESQSSSEENNTIKLPDTKTETSETENISESESSIIESSDLIKE